MKRKRNRYHKPTKGLNQDHVFQAIIMNIPVNFNLVIEDGCPKCYPWVAYNREYPKGFQEELESTMVDMMVDSASYALSLPKDEVRKMIIMTPT